jgi:hypothetical protein
MKQTDKVRLTRDILFVWIITLVTILCIREYYHQETISNMKTTKEALEDTIKVTRNKLGQSVGTSSVIQTSNPKDFLELTSRDTTIIKLQKLVKEYKSKLKGQGVAAIINSEGTIAVTVPTVVDSTDNVSPIYTSEYKLRDSLDTNKIWAWGNTIARKDSTKVFLKYKEEAELLIGVEKTGFLGLGKAKPFAQITFKNPYNEVKEMKIYQKDSPATKRFGIGPTVSYGLGSDSKPQVFIGIGLSWNIIRF